MILHMEIGAWMGQQGKQGKRGKRAFLHRLVSEPRCTGSRKVNVQHLPK